MILQKKKYIYITEMIFLTYLKAIYFQKFNKINKKYVINPQYRGQTLGPKCPNAPTLFEEKLCALDLFFLYKRSVDHVVHFFYRKKKLDGMSSTYLVSDYRISGQRIRLIFFYLIFFQCIFT